MNAQMGTTEDAPELVSASIVARKKKYLHPLSQRRIQEMCQQGIFKTATKLGSGRNSHWFISSHEVLQWKLSRSACYVRNES